MNMTSDEGLLTRIDLGVITYLTSGGTILFLYEHYPSNSQNMGYIAVAVGCVSYHIPGKKFQS